MGFFQEKKATEKRRNNRTSILNRSQNSSAGAGIRGDMDASLVLLKQSNFCARARKRLPDAGDQRDRIWISIKGHFVPRVPPHQPSIRSHEPLSLLLAITCTRAHSQLRMIARLCARPAPAAASSSHAGAATRCLATPEIGKTRS